MSLAAFSHLHHKPTRFKELEKRFEEAWNALGQNEIQGLIESLKGRIRAVFAVRGLNLEYWASFVPFLCSKLILVKTPHTVKTGLLGGYLMFTLLHSCFFKIYEFCLCCLTDEMPAFQLLQHFIGYSEVVERYRCLKFWPLANFEACIYDTKY